MHGTILLNLQKFIRKRGGPQGWTQLLKEAGLETKSYSAVQNFPDAELTALIDAASRIGNVSVDGFLGEFGQFLGPELLHLYASLIHPEWKTLEVISNTEELMHAAARALNPAAKPPMLDCMHVGENEIQIIYSSPRKLCSLAKGIVMGMARHFGETITVADQACMLKGDPFCALLVTRREPVEKGDVEAHKDTDSHCMADTQLPHEGRPRGRTNLDSVSFTTDQRGLYPFLAPPQRGDELGRLAHYRVLELLGQGGMGLVFRAEDDRLERGVALKVMQPHLAVDAKARQRFIREGRSMAALKSDHIVTIYDVGLLNEVPYLAMEFLEGESLEELQRKQGRLPLPHIMRIAREIAEGLAHAHAKGFIHRDIKPSNLWMESPSGRIKILDFGLAKAGAEIVQLSQSGGPVGTPAFMAPEQAQGELVDHRADLFSFGCVLYWLCTNELPFKGRDVFSVLMAVATKQPQPPLDLRPYLPPELSDLILQLLEKDPSHRPASSRIVAETLTALESQLTSAVHSKSGSMANVE